jgi:hypothetical protein
MRRISLVFALLVAAAVVVTVTIGAQTPRPVLATGNTVLIAEYSCDADQLARADTLFNEASSAILNKYVSSGKIISWGYFGLWLGGSGNRTVYVWAADPVALIQARAAYLPEIQANPRFAEFTKICGASKVSLHNMISLSSAAK